MNPRSVNGDAINPDYYKSHPSGVECIQITQEFCFCLGAALKYIWRAGMKPGADEIDDLKKARRYLDFEIARREGKASEPRFFVNGEPLQLSGSIELKGEMLPPLPVGDGAQLVTLRFAPANDGRDDGESDDDAIHGIDDGKYGADGDDADAPDDAEAAPVSRRPCESGVCPYDRPLP